MLSAIYLFHNWGPLLKLSVLISACVPNHDSVRLVAGKGIFGYLKTGSIYCNCALLRIVSLLSLLWLSHSHRVFILATSYSEPSRLATYCPLLSLRTDTGGKRVEIDISFSKLLSWEVSKINTPWPSLWDLFRGKGALTSTFVTGMTHQNLSSLSRSRSQNIHFSNIARGLALPLIESIANE